MGDQSLRTQPTKTNQKLIHLHYRLTGLDLDAHKLGLCKTSANADVKGEVKDDSFSATSLDNLKLNLPKVPSTSEGALDGIKRIGF